MIKSIKKVLLCIAFGVGLYVLLTNLDNFVGFFKTLYQLMIPVFLGFIMAFVLNVPMKALKKLYEFLFRNSKWKIPNKIVDVVCVILVLAMLALVVWAVVMLAIPSLVETVGDVIRIVQEQIPRLAKIFEENDIDPAVLEQIVDFLHLDEDYNMGFNISAIISPLFTTVKSMLMSVVNIIFALVVCIYALLSKAELHLQVRRLGISIFPEKIARYLGHVYALARDTYSRFLSAQCIEAVILGVLMFLAFLAFGLPYAGLVAVLTALFSFLPYIGAFGACFIGAFLTLVAEPQKVLLCIIVYTVVQFTENQFIYPHVVGNSVGLSPVWTLVAALVGGNLLGLFGMIFFIPLASVIYTLLGEFTTWRLNKKRLIVEDGMPCVSFDEREMESQMSFDIDNANDGAKSVDADVASDEKTVE